MIYYPIRPLVNAGVQEVLPTVPRQHQLGPVTKIAAAISGATAKARFCCPPAFSAIDENALILAFRFSRSAPNTPSFHLLVGD
jgi:hypothetical protein